MNARSTNHPAANLFGRLSSLVRPSSLVRIVLPVVAVLALSACVTDEEYARSFAFKTVSRAEAVGMTVAWASSATGLRTTGNATHSLHLNG